MIKAIYVFFLGLLLALFVGVGIATFYPAPQRPEYPAVLEKAVPQPSPTVTVEEQQARDQYEAASKAYDAQFKTYNRNVFIAALIFAIIMLVLGLAFMASMHVVSDGLLLGGLFTLVYSMIRGFMTDQNTYRFIVVTIGLIIAIIIGYIKFIKPENKKA